jgi:hypothetical protein
MKRRILCVAALVAGLAPFAALAVAPPAQAAEVIEVCLTVHEKFVGFTINGIPVGVRVPEIDRRCIGI